MATSLTSTAPFLMVMVSPGPARMRLMSTARWA